MAVDELGNEIITTPDPVEGRIKDLSNKVKTASEERDTERKARETAEAAMAAAEKKATFYKDFSKMSAEYKDAPEFADEIEAKVLSGYSTKDATISVLMDKGKFNPAPPVIERKPVTGGSATTPVSQGGTKPVSEMSRDEKRAALKEAEQRGDLSMN